jgi:NADH-quinone oxidoreductase subunit J
LLTDVLIVICCLTSLAGGAVVLFSKNPSRNLFGLFITALSAGVIFLLMGSPYLAMVQLIVYAGAILMLFLFVVRYFATPAKRSKLPWQSPLALLAVIVVFFQILIPVIPYLMKGVIKSWDDPPDLGVFGEVLMGRYLYQFELASVLLLVAIVSAIYIAREEKGDQEGIKNRK